jgi:hypothetical protein
MCTRERKQANRRARLEREKASTNRGPLDAVHFKIFKSVLHHVVRNCGSVPSSQARCLYKRSQLGVIGCVCMKTCKPHARGQVSWAQAQEDAHFQLMRPASSTNQSMHSSSCSQTYHPMVIRLDFGRNGLRLSFIFCLATPYSSHT